MKVDDRFTYKRNFQIGDHLHEHLCYETDARDGESPEESFDRAKSVVINFHKKSNPGLYVEYHPPTPEMMGYAPPTPKEEQPTDKIDSFIATINYCTNIKFLENFKKRVDEENVPKLTEAYYKKLKTFQ
jgi:hypothetical protein